MALLAGVVVDRLNSSFHEDSEWESNNSSLSDHSSPPSLSHKESVEKADEDPPVAYLTPTDRSKSANDHKTKSRKKSSQQTDGK